MLCTNGQPDSIRLNAGFKQFLCCHLRVSGTRRMNHKRFHIRHVSQQGKDLQSVDKILSFFGTTLYLESKDRTGAVGKIPVVKRMVKKAALMFSRCGNPKEILETPSDV